MPKPQWKDVTSYSRGEENRVPQSWEIAINGLRLVVTRKHGLEGWYTECYGFARFGSGSIPLDSTLIEDAKREALEALDKLLSQISRDVRDLVVD